MLLVLENLGGKSEEDVMVNQEGTTNLVKNTSELFDLFHFTQKMDLDISFERIADIGYPEEMGLNTSISDFNYLYDLLQV